MSVRGYTLGINWSRGPDYSGAMEDVTSYATKAELIVASWGRADPWASSDMAAGKLTYDLLNFGRQFSPENASSILYGKLVTGTPTQFLYVGAPILTGVIENYDVDTSINGTFSAECNDGWTRPGATELSTAVFQGQRTGDLIHDILDAVGWPAAARDIDAGATVVPYWWADGTSANQAVLDLVHSEGEPALAYVHNGVFTFRDRHHRLTRTASTTSQGIYTHIVPAGPIGTDHKILKDSFEYQHGHDRIANAATLEVSPRLPTTEQVVWSTTDPIVMASAEVQTFFIRTDDPVINVQVPSATFSYLTSEGSTFDYVIATGSATFALSRTSGQSMILTITAGGGGLSILTGLRVRGTPLQEVTGRKFTAADTLSQGTYGVSEWAGEAPWAYYYDAQAIVDQAVATYSQPKPSVKFDIEGEFGPATLARIMNSDISDRITVRNDRIGLNADFHIEQLEHRVQQLGVRHTQTVGAQAVAPVQAANPFTFDVAGDGFNQGQFTAYAGNSPASMFRFDVAGRGFDQGTFAL